MNPEYFETRFRTKELQVDFPEEFFIITAFPTTGEKWSSEQIREADQRLYEELKARKNWLISIEGYSPTTGHAEAGWATLMEMDEACETGMRYKQDAIFHVKEDELSVTHCDQLRKLIRIGSFDEHLDQ